MDSDSDEERKEKTLPPYRIRYNDMPTKLVKEVVRCNFERNETESNSII